jgi:multidrug efflux pump subunit AcrA (membrane-fusion protein)
MFADVDVLLHEGLEALVVPRDAVLEDGRQTIVFVKTGDSFASREVKTGAVNGEYLEVLDGLEAGEEVVIEGNHLLRSKLKQAVLQQAHPPQGHAHGHRHRRGRQGQ